MRATVAPALRERLGEEPTLALVALMDETGREWKGDVMEVMTERFGRMLAEETGKLRVLIAEQTARFDARFAEQTARFDARFAELPARFDARLAEQRADLLKWSFLFWIGQVAAIAALLAFMLRGLRG